jgi:ribonuclease HI
LTLSLHSLSLPFLFISFVTISHPAPQSDEILIYVDAARDDQISGLGYIITGEVSLEGHKFLTGHYTSMEAELHALLEAVRVASIESEYRESCEVRTDAKPLVSKICGPDETREDWAEYQASARWLLNKFDAWEVNHTSRSHNEDAHDLARKALKEGRESL